MKTLSMLGLAVFGIIVCVAATTFSTSTGDPKMAVTLLLDGKPFEQTSLSTVTRGVLTMNSLESETQMPFRIYLKRGDQKISFGNQPLNGKGQYETEIGLVMSRARFGDALVIETVGNETEHTKPRVVLTKYLFPLIFKKGSPQNEDGC